MNNIKKIAVTTKEPENISAACELADTLGLPFINPQEPTTDYDYLLIFTANYLGLQTTKAKRSHPFYIDFLSKKWLYRRKQAGLKKELLARAMGVKPDGSPFIVDATAGLGQDSFLLASLGFEITMIERSIVLYALLNDALKRAKREKNLTSTIERMHLFYADAQRWLKAFTTTKRPDVIYLDPMFSEKRKSALAKKEMVILQDLIGKDLDADQLLKLSLTCATNRVVVKRHRLSHYLGNIPASFSLTGRSSRFDIYTNLAGSHHH